MIVIMRDAVMPDCCNTCVCSEGYGCGITGTVMTTKEMEERPDWCPLEEQEPCEDAVSRAELLHIFEKNCYPVHYDHNSIDVGMTLPGIVEVLNIATSVTPKRKTGKWYLMDDGYCDFFICGECGKQNGSKSNFCPHCGADMRGEQDG